MMKLRHGIYALAAIFMLAACDDYNDQLDGFDSSVGKPKDVKNETYIARPMITRKSPHIRALQTSLPIRLSTMMARRMNAFLICLVMCMLLPTMAQ